MQRPVCCHRKETIISISLGVRIGVEDLHEPGVSPLLVIEQLLTHCSFPGFSYVISEVHQAAARGAVTKLIIS